MFFLFHLNFASAMLGNETDQLALLAFKKEITEDPFEALSSWNTSLNFCKWQGVTCSRRRQRVTALDLQSKKLKGKLSPSMANLTFLQILNLGDNCCGNRVSFHQCEQLC
ncbi:hypothetical protein DITRI_Ditri09bG0149500 [Diplodiscus trichospermus]